jgi:ABC-type siderophore export system fused ATPase/permease subunit
MLQAMNATMDTILTTLVTLLNIIFFIYFAEKPLLPAYTVFAIGFYMRLCNSMGFNFTRAMIYFSNYRVSAKRVGKFLLTKELDLSKIKEPADKKAAIDIKDFTFTWNDIDATGFGLSKINLQIKKGELVSIVGPIGSGKVEK